MKYKLLKDTPTHKAGEIKSDIAWARLFPDFVLDNVIDNPEWFKKVSDFKKKLRVVEICDDIELKETFETFEQAKAIKELKEHIYKFDEPKEGGEYYLICSHGACKYRDYGNFQDRSQYHSGLMINRDATDEDIINRKELLEKAYKL